MKNKQPEYYILGRLKNHVGEENAITGKEIGIPGSELRYYINKLRKKGFPICSSGNGYWWARDWQDINRVSKSLKRRAKAINEAAYYLENSDINKTI